MSEHDITNPTAAGGDDHTPLPEDSTLPQDAGKTFTQAQLNQIVQDRLARNEEKYQADRARLMAQITTYEQNTALRLAGVPEGLMEQYRKLAAELYPNDEGDFAKSLHDAMTDFPLHKTGKQMPVFAAPTSDRARSARDPVREGMGLNRKE